MKFRLAKELITQADRVSEAVSAFHGFLVIAEWLAEFVVVRIVELLAAVVLLPDLLVEALPALVGVAVEALFVDVHVVLHLLFFRHSRADCARHLLHLFTVGVDLDLEDSLVVRVWRKNFGTDLVLVDLAAPEGPLGPLLSDFLQLF